MHCQVEIWQILPLPNLYVILPRAVIKYCTAGHSSVKPSVN